MKQEQKHLVDTNKYVEALLHSTGGHPMSRKDHQAGNQTCDKLRGEYRGRGLTISRNLKDAITIITVMYMLVKGVPDGIFQNGCQEPTKYRSFSTQDGDDVADDIFLNGKVFPFKTVSIRSFKLMVQLMVLYQ